MKFCAINCIMSIFLSLLFPLSLLIGVLCELPSTFDRNCSFTLIKKNEKLFLSLSLNATNSENSLLFQLKKRNLIKFTTFFTSAQSDIGTSLQIIGERTEKCNNGYKCDVSETNSWMCKFEEICVDEKCNVKYKNKHPVLIEPFSITVVPFDFIELIRKKYYEAEFRSKKCRYDYDNEIELFYINCENKNINLNLTFLNGNEGLTAKVNKLYSYHSSEEWVISQSMCRSFFFDFDNKGVYFLGAEKISKNSAIIHFINFVLYHYGAFGRSSSNFSKNRPLHLCL